MDSNLALGIEELKKGIYPCGPSNTSSNNLEKNQNGNKDLSTILFFTAALFKHKNIETT